MARRRAFPAPTLLRVVALMLGAGAILAACQTVGMAPAGPGTSPAAAVPQTGGCRVVRVIDGDTVDMTCPGAGAFRARLTGFDTPEAFEPGCPAEARAAQAATARLSGMVRAARVVEARLSGTDRFGRRLVALSLDGRDVGAVLIAEGLAVPYEGGRRGDWCARLG